MKLLHEEETSSDVVLYKLNNSISLEHFQMVGAIHIFPYFGKF